MKRYNCTIAITVNFGDAHRIGNHEKEVLLTTFFYNQRN